MKWVIVAINCVVLALMLGLIYGYRDHIVGGPWWYAVHLCFFALFTVNFIISSAGSLWLFLLNKKGATEKAIAFQTRFQAIDSGLGRSQLLIIGLWIVFAVLQRHLKHYL